MRDDRPSVSIVIPTLNAGPWISNLLDKLRNQTPTPPDEIIVIDSGSTDNTLAVAAADERVTVIEIQKFSHGGARNLGVQTASSDIVVLMTQDAEPSSEGWLQALIAPLSDESVAATYSRQVPRDDASPMERFFLADRFPDGEQVRREYHGDGVPVYPDTFFSNVSSAARKDTWQAFPFDESLLMSEDQKFARDVLMAGKAIIYEPSSVTLHSHSYNLRQTFKRYFDSVVAFRQLSAGHGAGESAKLGQVTLGREIRYIAKTSPCTLPYFALYMVFKSAGVIAGHLATYLPRGLCRRFSMNSSWWRDGRLER